MKAARRNTQRVNWDQMWIQESRFFSPGHEMLWEIPNMWGWKCFSLALAFFLLPTLWSSTRLVGRRRTSYFTASTWHLLEAEGKQLREWRSLFPFFYFLVSCLDSFVFSGIFFCKKNSQSKIWRPCSFTAEGYRKNSEYIFSVINLIIMFTCFELLWDVNGESALCWKIYNTSLLSFIICLNNLSFLISLLIKNTCILTYKKWIYWIWKFI